MSTHARPVSAFFPAHLSASLACPERTLHAQLYEVAQRVPERIATAFYGATLVYRELVTQIDALAGYLQHVCNVQPGERVLLDMQNSPSFVIAYYAILRAGATVVPLSPMNTAVEIERVAKNSAARVALVGEEVAERFATLTAGTGHLIVARYADFIDASTDLPLPAVVDPHTPARTLPPGSIAWHAALAAGHAPRADLATPDDRAVLIYTSGTTGEAKGCPHTHRSTLFTALAQAAWYSVDATSVVSTFMPLFHVAGMQGSMNAGLTAGATLVLIARWDREIVPTLFERHGITFWNAPPTMVVDVLASPAFSERTFATLRTLTGGGAPMPPAIAEQLHARFGLTFIEGYGMSETMSPTHINPPAACRKGSIGVPIFDTDARVIDPATGHEVRDGETGEIVVHGPQVLAGYWNNEKATAESFVELEGKRFLRTGDLGSRDADGYFYLVDRIKRMINCSGFKVWPAEIEAVLYQHPAIRECCVIAVPDAYRGEAARALIVKRDDVASDEPADEAAFVAWLRSRVATYKLPREVRFVEAMPRSASNKIDWRRLQDEARAETAPG